MPSDGNRRPPAADGRVWVAACLSAGMIRRSSTPASRCRQPPHLSWTPPLCQRFFSSLARSPASRFGPHARLRAQRSAWPSGPCLHLPRLPTAVKQQRERGPAAPCTMGGPPAPSLASLPPAVLQRILQHMSTHERCARQGGSSSARRWWLPRSTAAGGRPAPPPLVAAPHRRRRPTSACPPLQDGELRARVPPLAPAVQQPRAAAPLPRAADVWRDGRRAAAAAPARPGRLARPRGRPARAQVSGGAAAAAPACADCCETAPLLRCVRRLRPGRRAARHVRRTHRPPAPGSCFGCHLFAA